MTSLKTLIWEIVFVLSDQDQGSQNKKQLEEMYEKLFPKIARDFVFAEDLQEILVRLEQIINIFASATGSSTPFVSQVGQVRAMAKGIIYKDVVESGKDGSKLFIDLLPIDDDDDSDDE